MKITKESLKKGLKVVHEKYDRPYIVISCNMRFKDSANNWTDGVAYMPLYKKPIRILRKRLKFIPDRL